MAYLIAEFERGPGRCLRVYVAELCGTRTVVLIEYDMSRRGVWMPTHRSVGIRPDSIPELVAALERAQAATVPLEAA
jgi:hypothetical protein